MVAIDLSNYSAKAAFALSTDAIAGKATHFISGDAGELSEEIYRKLRFDFSALGIAPIIESGPIESVQESSTDNPIVSRRWTLVGVDPLAEQPFRSYLDSKDLNVIGRLMYEANTVLMARQSAYKSNLNLDDKLTLNIGGENKSVKVVGWITPDNSVSKVATADLIISDISTAQELLRSKGLISRIDLIIPKGKSGTQIVDIISNSLPDNVNLLPSSSRSESVTQLTNAFELNLTALSLLTLLVGSFLIYNTVTFSVVRRRNLIGILRAIGVTRSEIFMGIVVEAFILGLVSTAIGIGLGIVLAHQVIDIVTQNINDHFFQLVVEELIISYFGFFKAAILGVGITVVASIVPAYEATVVSPGSAISRLSFEIGFSRLLPKLTLLGLAISGVGCGVLLFPSKNIILGFVGLFGLVIGLALIVLVSTNAGLSLTRRMSSLRFSITSLFAIKLLAGSVSRISLAIAALSMAVSLTVGIGVMVQSFRLTVDHWLETSLGRGIYVSPDSMSLTRFDSIISPEVLVRLKNIEGVTKTTAVRHLMVDTVLGPSHLVVADTDFESFNRPAKFKKGNPRELWEEFNNSDIVLISEPFAYHKQLTIGDSFAMLTDYGYKEFRVAGIQYDYSSSSGIITVSKQTYGEYWQDKKVSSVRLHVSPSQGIDSLIEEIYESTQNIQPLQIRSNDVLRKSALEVFDRSFTITSVMRYIAVLVALIGVVGALMALQLERAREYGIAGVIGFIPLQIRKVVMLQTSLIGLLAGLFSLPIGIILAYGLVHVVNERSFGWSMELYISYKVLFEAILISLVGSILAGVYPAIKISRSSLSSQLSEE